MRRLLAVTLLVASPVVLTPPAAASAAARRCGTVTVELGHGAEGSAGRIRARHVPCRRARRLARRCMKGTLTVGWAYAYRSGRIVLSRSTRRVTWVPAGGGGCGG